MPRPVAEGASSGFMTSDAAAEGSTDEARPASIRSGRSRLAAILLNVIVPGCGLIVAGREWQGVLLALLFGLCAHAALAGALFAPVAVPAAITWSAAGAASLIWLAAQMVLLRRLRGSVREERRSADASRH
jgi:hypothetical protein